MTKDEALKLAIKAGAYFDEEVHVMPEHCFEIFAKLVEEHILKQLNTEETV